MKPALFGCSGPELTAEETSFFKEAQPFGFILFGRNCVTPDQVIVLVKALRAATGRADTPIFIDQEGGRVARLKPPHWPVLPPLREIGALYEKDPKQGIESARQHAQGIAKMLTALGIDGNCAPVLDRYIDGASTAIGDRALSSDPAVIATLGREIVQTFLENGVMPVIKHIPGHGRVSVDPHETLPVVDAPRSELERQDFLPFRALCDAPVGMNCHVVFKDLDPAKPVSLSLKVHLEIIRGLLGFKGLLFSDDLAMKALSGALPDLALQALKAGADVVLYCPGKMPEMREIAKVLPDMDEQALIRWQAVRARLKAVAKRVEPVIGRGHGT